MEFNNEYISLRFSLIKAFLIDIGDEILDISYLKNGNKISVQVVLLEGQTIPSEVKERIRKDLFEYQFQVKEIYISKEQFNETKGGWIPSHYTWLENVLFSKAEVL
jgi:hypothetical protein